MKFSPNLEDIPREKFHQKAQKSWIV